MNEKQLVQNYDAYVICSTLNQVVNYIPLKMLQDKGVKIGKIINIKVKSKGSRKQFNSDNWDKNLIEVLKDNNEIDKNEILDNKEFKNNIILEREFDFKEYKDFINSKIESLNKILWNITGGQRSTVVAIQEIVRKRYADGKKDVMIYLEGNTNDIIIGTCGENGEIKYTKYDEKYEIKDLTIEKAMKLAGFDLYGKGNKCINYLNRKYVISEKIDKLLDKFYDNYKDINSQKFRLNMIATNKKKGENYGVPVGEEAWKNIIKEYEFMKCLKEGIFEKEGKKEENKNQYQFGYLLEFIIVKKIKEIINEKIREDDKLKGYFIDLKHSLKIRNNYDELKEEKQFCEFDVVLLTKAGQLIIFECKSGGMTGEVAKARHYTSYAVGGVYGTPIVITPLLSIEIEQKDKLDSRKYTNGEDSKNVCKDIYSAIEAAKKSNIDVWGIDELDTKLEKLFEDVTGKE
ncbi:hypothetical protein [Tepidibacter thalassicus]|uniref:Uncharacterized protein n=1 Tax=Tepidibacter thalassicus DSM 15285 TaxID=1123350 RepID=A0A1M5TSQ6_9FIRM|nr:hypothetical protein [Tepidibacter thalassicus]SHH53822.1 hypothetical protein SAMN02744040_02286 [Tepidibacter thalassicus DSM 15285]